jgi:hypothetical protein
LTVPSKRLSGFVTIEEVEGSNKALLSDAVNRARETKRYD